MEAICYGCGREDHHEGPCYDPLGDVLREAGIVLDSFERALGATFAEWAADIDVTTETVERLIADWRAGLPARSAS